jgi:2-polyprenyl-3-methyl-5-hydroxy-6-metoxy-1,4-benzoquinol methylase
MSIKRKGRSRNRKVAARRARRARRASKNNAWYDDTIVPREMIRGAKAEIPGWKTLENTTHFLALDSLVKKSGGESIVDIGCGAAEVGRIYSNMKYAGADLPHIIEGVAEKVNPGKVYIKFDANESNKFDVIKEYDIILMNSFLSELSNPLEFLEKSLQNSKKYIIIHRQDFNNEKTFLENYKSYGGKLATSANINYKELAALVEKYNFEIAENISSNLDNKRSVLIKRK